MESMDKWQSWSVEVRVPMDRLLVRKRVSSLLLFSLSLLSIKGSNHQIFFSQFTLHYTNIGKYLRQIARKGVVFLDFYVIFLFKSLQFFTF